MNEQDKQNQGDVPPRVLPKNPSADSGGTAAAPRPITVKLKSVAVAPTTPPTSSPRTTSRVELPEAPVNGSPASSAIRPVTVRLRPMANAAAPGRTQSVGSIPDDATAETDPKPTTPRPSPTPGSKPLPPGTKPPSPAQQQAAKSKTSRISLESVIGVAGGPEKDGPKTIRLKRPTDLGPAPASPKSATSVVRKTARIPDSALPTIGEGPSDTVTQKKTLRIKRTDVKSTPASGEAETDSSFPEGVQMKPISMDDFPAGGETSSVLTSIAALSAVAATFLLFLTVWYLAAHAIGPVASPNSMAFIKGPEIPCPGRLSQ